MQLNHKHEIVNAPPNYYSHVHSKDLVWNLSDNEILF
jgi:hypothetical protein